MGLMVNDDNLISDQDAGGKVEEPIGEPLSDPLTQGKEESEGFKELYEQSLQSVQMGGVLSGKVVQINADSIMVDVGWKTEGYIPARELRDEQGNISIRVGDEIEVLVDRRDQDGNLVLSRDKAAKIKIWDDVKSACEKNSPITGIVVERVKGGLSVDIGIPAFLPGSQVDIRPVRDLDRYVGQSFQFNVLKYDRKRNNVVLSRRSILEKERVALGLKQLTPNPWETIKDKYPINSIVEGRVVNLTDYGVFVEIEPGVEGLIHVSEMFWTREIRHPSKILSVGQRIGVMILDINIETKRISLGLKQTTPNPWETLKEKDPEGSVIKGMVLNIDVEHEKFSLGLKQIEKNPWEELNAKYPPGTPVTGKVTNITDFGIFVELEEGIEGLVHISELSSKRVKTSSELFSVGDMVSAIIKNVDPKSRKIRLSIKDFEAGADGHAAHQYINNRENVGSSLSKALADVKVKILDTEE